MSVEYSLSQLNQIIASAEALRFWDDVEHFTLLRDELIAEGQSS